MKKIVIKKKKKEGFEENGMAVFINNFIRLGAGLFELPDKAILGIAAIILLGGLFEKY